jgi:endonuclease/exonuclease/phosphatase family metal-dependent hydrolase
MKYKKGYFFLYHLLFGVVAVLIIFSYLSQYVSPLYGSIFYFFSLGVLYIQLISWIFVVWAGISRKKIWFAVLLVLQVLGIENYYVTYAFHHEKKITEEYIKVLTYNIKNFEWGTESILNHIAAQQPDIVCLQEVWDYKKAYNHHYNFANPLENLQKKTKLPYLYFYPKMQDNFGLAILSKYPIVRKENIPFKSNGVNGIMYADIMYKKDKIRIYNVHLQSMNLAYNPKYEKETGKIKYDTPDKRKFILRQLTTSAIKRTEQLNLLISSIQKCEYPVIMAGDFNSTPYTHTYKQLTKKLQDNFIVSGKGFGYTFGTYPLRIDYIFTDKKFKTLYTYCERTPYSDHKMVVSYIKP